MSLSSRIKRASPLLVGGLALCVLSSLALAEQVSQEQYITDLRLGQRIQVDDGTCPAGEIKEVFGAKITATGILRVRRCIPRAGSKK